MTDDTAAEPGTDVAVADEAGAVATTVEETVAPHEVEHAHPDVKQYVFIAVILVIVTALEIGTSYIDTERTNFIIVALLVMAVVKFVLVSGWYMHMKTDHPIFRRFFVVGLIGAGIVYGIVFLVFSSTVLKS